MRACERRKRQEVGWEMHVRGKDIGVLAAEISEWIREQVESAGAEGVVVGMSGGLDSSVTAVLCKRAFPDATLGLIMPCESEHEDIEHARLVAAKYEIKTKEIDLSHVFVMLLRTLEPPPRAYSPKDIAIANLKPRLRMLTLYYFANKLNYLVAGTENKSELMVGYFTKYGDGAADILPLGDLYKTEVRQLAEFLGIPDEILRKKPSAGLWRGQTDESEIGMSYDELDKILKAIESWNFTNCDMEEVERVRKMVERAKHKRERPPVFKISP